MIVNMSKREDSHYGNDEDIYEIERLENVMFMNQPKIRDDSFIETDDMANSKGPKMGQSSLRTMTKQKSVKDLRLPLLILEE